MGDKTGIEWASLGLSRGATWNPIRAYLQNPLTNDPPEIGWACVKHGPGCRLCYAEYMNVTKPFGMGTGLPYQKSKMRLIDHGIDLDTFDQPLRWTKPRGIFVCSMTDLYLPEYKDYLKSIFTLMRLAQRHRFITMTKRYNEAWKFLSNGHTYFIKKPYRTPRVEKALDEPAQISITKNIIHGFTVNTSKEADELWPIVADLKHVVPGIKIAISQEPALEYIDWNGFEGKIDWLIYGGESGPANMHPRKIEKEDAILTQRWCEENKIPFFFKQWGGGKNPDKNPKLDGKGYHEFPEV